MDSAMLRHREKRRYFAISYSETQSYKPFQLHEIIVKRFKELFGVLHCELAMLRLYDSEFGNTLLIGCKLKYLDYFLFSLSMTQPPVIVLSLSGTLKKLRKNVSALNLETLKTIEAKYKKGMR
jgi:RNase P/RNase MRP subunit POP5